MADRKVPPFEWGLSNATDRLGCAFGLKVPDSRLGACNHLIAWTFAAVFLFVATSAVVQDQKKPQPRSVSPDGKWQLRTGAAGEQNDFVIAKAGSDETFLVLSEEGIR